MLFESLTLLVESVEILSFHESCVAMKVSLFLKAFPIPLAKMFFYFALGRRSRLRFSALRCFKFAAASMLIRNMLRVNPERRADIDDIASHWWLNLEENMPVIQELPENQVHLHLLDTLVAAVVN